jgi:hypothetical protein
MIFENSDFFHRGNIQRLHQKYQPVYKVYGSNHRLFLRSQEAHKYTLWAKYTGSLMLEQLLLTAADLWD